MGTKEKLIDRLKSLPADFTFDEAARLLLHKPHPGNTLKRYALESIIDKLIRNKNI